MKVLNFTDQIKETNFNDRISLNSSELNFINSGLYLMIFKNNSEINIRDKNRPREGKDAGKIVIPAKSTVLKSGKFEKGLISRLRGYHSHLHFENEVEVSAFQETLVEIKVLPLDFMTENMPYFRPSLIFEEYWNQTLHNHLSNTGLLTPNQNHRSEYRNIYPNNEILSSIFIEKVALKIKKLYDVISDNL